MMLRSLLGVLLVLVPTAMTHARSPENQVELETSVCGLKEPFLFWLWSSMAGSADESRLAGLSGVEDIAFSTQDGRELRGYRLPSRRGPAIGYLLVLQGNAILADQLIGNFTRYADAGYDVYMYDYRGYGRSQGKRRLKAMISDIQAIINSLNNKPYTRHLIYAFSFGGIVFLDGYHDSLHIHKAVIDSSPSRLSDHGCSQAYDPVSHLPADSSHLLLISGQRDTVVTPAMSQELMTQAAERQAHVIRDAEFAHPFMDPDFSHHQRRMRVIDQFLLDTVNEQN